MGSRSAPREISKFPLGARRKHNIATGEVTIMKLIVKFNLVLFLVFAVGFGAVGYFTNRLLQRNAKEEIIENARIMMEAALAVRAYTTTQIKPLLETQIKYSFLPQIVPAYSANQYFGQLKKKFPEYAYKEATLNPTNPMDRATDWEADVVNVFRQSPDLTEQVGERETPSGKAMYMARPLRIKDAKCLDCHDTADTAPRTVIERYGSDNGFGWKLNDVVGAQIVTAPVKLPVQRARSVFAVFMTSLAAVFIVLVLALNMMLFYLVIRPVNQLSKTANEVSLGNLEAPDFEISSRDEISDLAESFRRMRKSLVEAIKMLET
jgi:protein-histidine pros-kinase